MKNKVMRSVKKRILTVLFVSVAVLFVVIFGMTTVECVKVFTSDAERAAETKTQEAADLFDACAREYVLKTELLAADLKGDIYVTDDEYKALDDKLRAEAAEKGFLSLSVFDDRGEHHSMETPYYGDSSEVTALLARTTGNSIVSVLRSESAGRFCVAIYAPVSEDADSTIRCVCGIFSAQEVFDSDEAKALFSDYQADAFVVGADDSYYICTGADDSDKAERMSFYNYMVSFAGSEEVAKEIRSALQTRDFGSVRFSAKGTEYVFSFSRMGKSSSAYLSVIYERNVLLNREGNFYTKFVVAIINLSVIFALALIFYFLEKYRKHKEELQAEEFDPVIKCSTYAKFKKDAERLILDNRALHYAVVCLDIHNFKYVQDHFGEDIAEDAKRFASSIFSSVLQKNETYGHLTGDRFVLLLRYEVKSEISSRLTLIGELINHYTPFRKNNFFCLFSIGVYYILPAETVDIDALLNKAYLAQLAHKKTPTAAYIPYDESLYENYRVEANIESKMEGALKKCDFHLFYQPKYNIAKQCLDGAETLVRWYDMEHNGYVPPQKFVPLFELNGFINKLDRYVFIHACEFFANAVRNGLRVTPISVNVSRVTAIQKDFVSFYATNKTKYNIPDGYITIEFTESFSFTNMDVLKNIVLELKKTGFRCSIDDFGAGYSSCGVLKELPVDELKLDMFLLKASDNPQKDDALVEMMIRLGKSFEMKVTQEGVETMEQFEKLKAMGCDVIQGYLYSKPLLTDDFQSFVNGTTDLESVMKRNVEAPYKKPKYIDFLINK